MIQVEVKKEIVLVVDEKELKLTEEQAKKLLDSLKVILEPVATLTITNSEKEIIYVPVYPQPYPSFPYPSYPWVTYYKSDTLNSETYQITC